ncbi:DUF2442 domain-containing protein [Mesoterricola silvestris]|nr:DUF2442 domain-containing protein [Mesoterricola silvestris]
MDIMNTVNALDTKARRVWVESGRILLETEDGRTVAVPVSTYPQLAWGKDEDLKKVRLLGGGKMIHWPRLEEALRPSDLLRDGKVC